MMDIGGKPFLGLLVDMLKERGLSTFLFLLGYKSEVIIRFLEAVYPGSRMEYSVESEPLGTGGALKYAEARLDDEFLLLNGDTFLDMDYDRFIAGFRALNTMAAMAVFDNRQNTRVVNNIALSKAGKVTAYRKTGGPDLTHVEAGVIAYRKSVLDLVPSGQPYSMENNIYPRLIECGEMGGVEVTERFYDIGTPVQLEEFKERILRRTP
jgi:D-glycero-alpha-D-manno-heptose 1-phosphate guanylyltransferase